MAIFKPGLRPVEQPRDKGLKTGALGLVSSVVMGVASTAPAYSLAATLFFVVGAVALHSPLVAVLAFVAWRPVLTAPSAPRPYAFLISRIGNGNVAMRLRTTGNVSSSSKS